MSTHNNKFYFFANWKMYLDFDEANILANAIVGQVKKLPDNIKMAIFPNALSLYASGQVLKDAGIAVGAQNVYWVDKGGYTGEISAAMYKAAGCEYALVGHSERRHQFHETNHEVRQKLEAILTAGLTPVLCVGETKDERRAGKTDEVVEAQLRAAFHELAWPAERQLIVAYEPVWAIGTGEACDPAEAQRLHRVIRKILHELSPGVEIVLLYGGSVRPDNVVDYLKQKDIHGVLVGGAATKLDGLLDILSKMS